MRCVYVCSPIRGNIPENTSKLQAYADYVSNNGRAPVLPFKRERDSKSLIFICDEVWVFGSTITDEMVSEINLAKSINLTVKYVKDSEVINDE